MVTWHGKQIMLAKGEKDETTGPTYLAALAKFKELVELQGADQGGDGNSCRVVMELFLRHVEASLSAASLRFRLKFLKPFAERFGEVRVRDLTRHQFNAWLADMRTARTNPETGKRKAWNDTTVNAAIGVIVTAFKWAIGEGLIRTNPLEGMKKPHAKSRGEDALIGRTREERDRNLAQIFDAATPAFLPFLKVLAATGARPGELANATSANFDANMGAIVHLPDAIRPAGLYRHKNAGRGKTRIILLTGEALDIVKTLAAKHATGPLFRTSRPLRGAKKGLPSKWTTDVIVHRLYMIRKATGLKGVTAYSFRHQVCTDWIKAGKSVDRLAALMGNSATILRKVYSHLLADPGSLRAELEAFNAEENGSR
jgi:integrase